MIAIAPRETLNNVIARPVIARPQAGAIHKTLIALPPRGLPRLARNDGTLISGSLSLQFAN